MKFICIIDFNGGCSFGHDKYGKDYGVSFDLNNLESFCVSETVNCNQPKKKF